MRDSEASIEEWVDELTAAHPNLAPLTEQFVDHLHCAVDELVDVGHAPTEAARIAIANFGDDVDLASQYDTADRQSFLACLRNQGRKRMALSSAYVLLSMSWTAVMLAVEESVTWAITGWTLTTFLPFSCATALLQRGDKACP